MVDKFAETDAAQATREPVADLHQDQSLLTPEDKPQAKDNSVAVLGFPEAKISGDKSNVAIIEQNLQPTKLAEFIQPVTGKVTVGSFIQREVPFSKIEAKPFTSVLDIASDHLGQGAPRAIVEAHASEIAAANPSKFDQSRSLPEMQTNDFTELYLPGHKADGSIIYTDSQGNTRTYAPDQTVTMQRSDGSGYQRKPAQINGNDVLLEQHFGLRADDNFEVVFSADGKFLSTSKSDTAPGSLSFERQNLAHVADQNLFVARENKAFKSDMQAFEQRAKSQGLPPEEIAKTYRDLSAILSIKGQEPMTSRERARLVTGTLRNAASPRSISQGEYNTCQTAVIEERIYAKTPSIATNIMLQIARRGEFDTVDGTHVKMQHSNMRAHGEAALNPAPGVWLRSYASQIFQTAAINTILTRANESAIPPQDIRYVQAEHKRVVMPPRTSRLELTDKYDNAPTGEMLMDYSQNPPVKIANQTSTGNIDQMRGLYHQLTGKDRPDLFLVPESLSAYQKDFASGSTFKTKEELAAYLTSLRQKEHGDIYAAIAVHANSDTLINTNKHMPLAGEPNLIKLEADNHVLSVVDYDPKTQMVKVDGSWGNDRDFIEKPMTLGQLYNATQTVTGERWMQRLEGIKNKIKGEEFDMHLAMVMFTMHYRWDIYGRKGLSLPEDDVNKTLNYYKQLRQGRQLPELGMTDQLVLGLESRQKH